MAREAAAIDEISCITQSKMYWMAHQIIDQHCVARDPQRFIGKLDHLLRLEVMQEQAAADHVKAIVFEGQGECITGNCAEAAIHTRILCA